MAEHRALRAALDRAGVAHLCGGRQTGKTTLLRGIAAELKGASAGARVLFAPARRLSVREGGLEAWIGDRLGAERRPATLVVDDVHLLADWQDQTDRLRQRGVRLILGGQHDPADGAVPIRLGPLTFRQWAVRRHPHALRGLPGPLERRHLLGSPSDLRDRLWQVRRQASARGLSWNRHLQVFAERGGYPALLDDRARPGDLLQADVIERTLGIDVPERVPIEQPDLLRRLLLAMARRTGEEISQGELARDLSSAQPVVGRYLGHLVDVGLVREIRRYPESASARVPSKYALVDPALRGAITATSASPWESEPFAATMLQTSLRNVAELGFWRDYRKPGDRRSPMEHVSLVVHDGRSRDPAVLPLQIDCTADVGSDREAALRRFLRRFSCTQGLLVTRDSFRIAPEDPVIRVPLSELMIAL